MRTMRVHDSARGLVFASYNKVAGPVITLGMHCIVRRNVEPARGSRSRGVPVGSRRSWLRFLLHGPARQLQPAQLVEQHQDVRAACWWLVLGSVCRRIRRSERQLSPPPSRNYLSNACIRYQHTFATQSRTTKCQRCTACTRLCSHALHRQNCACLVLSLPRARWCNVV
jgi:hypothetical protein